MRIAGESIAILSRVGLLVAVAFLTLSDTALAGDWRESISKDPFDDSKEPRCWLKHNANPFEFVIESEGKYVGVGTGGYAILRKLRGMADSYFRNCMKLDYLSADHCGRLRQINIVLNIRVNDGDIYTMRGYYNPIGQDADYLHLGMQSRPLVGALMDGGLVNLRIGYSDEYKDELMDRRYDPNRMNDSFDHAVTVGGGGREVFETLKSKCDALKNG